MPAVVQIVDNVGGPVLLDLNSAAGGVMLGDRDQIDLTSVSSRSSLSSSPAYSSAQGIADLQPQDLTARQITVPVVMFADSADAAAVLVRQLLTLTSTRFVLKLQRHGASNPMWLRCMPAAPKLSSNVVAAGVPTTIVSGSITAVCDPYALGARVDVGPWTVTQDPASGTPFVIDISSVAGDSLTPLVLTTTDGDVMNWVDRTLITTRRRGDPTALSGLVVQAEAGTTTAPTGAPTLSTITSDSDMSGGSAIRATYTALASGPWWVDLSFSSLAGVEAPGLYRLLVRCRRTGGAVGQPFTLVAQAGNRRSVEAFTAGGLDTRIIDLGLVPVPVGQPAFTASPQTPNRATAPTITVAVVRAAAGTGTFDLDWAGLFPCDSDAGALEVTNVDTASGTLVLDGWDQQARVYSAHPFTGTNPSALGAPAIDYVGGMPRLRPGSNRLYVVCGLGATSATSGPRTLAASLAFSGSYWPRYGWLA